jgi:hypothetical protein
MKNKDEKYFQEKEKEINKILNEDIIDMDKIREICLKKGGLLNNSFRVK